MSVNLLEKTEKLTLLKKNMKSKKIALVSDQIAGGIGGAESILFAAQDLYPEAPIYTTVLNRDILPTKYKNYDYKTSIIQDLPFSQKIYKAYFPLMPMAVELFNLQEYDVIFSSHHCVAKGVIQRPDASHICYCHSPARYIWDMFWSYSNLNNYNLLKKLMINALSQYLRMWDVTSSNRVDLFLANSKFTKARINTFYRRDAIVLHPPVDTNKFKHEEYSDYYLMVGRLVAYKGYELAIEAFNESGKKLVIIGDGVELNRLKAKANNNIIFKGKVSNESLIQHMNNCKGFIFPGKEDFGIVMAEAQSAGKPVIAYNAGGALDIVNNLETGILFNEQTLESLNEAVKLSENIDWQPNLIRDSSKRFDKELFKLKLHKILENAEDYKKIS